MQLHGILALTFFVLYPSERNLAEAVEKGTSLPPLAHSSWFDTGVFVDEKSILDRAHALITTGLSKLGYDTLIISDGWALETRGFMGELQPDPKRFPSGIRALSKEVHKLGLKIGIHTDRGPMTCAGQPGSKGHEAADAAQFSLLFNVDYVESGSCSGPQDHSSAFNDYNLMYTTLQRLALLTRRPVFFAAHGGFSYYAPQALVRRFADSVHVGATPYTWDDVLMNYDSVAHLYAYTGSNALGENVGWVSGGPINPNLEPQQRRTQFSLAVITSSPIVIGYDLSHLDPFDRETLMNPEVIEVSQDLAGHGSERSVGGPNAWAVPPVWSVHKCNASSPLQQWRAEPVDEGNPSRGVRLFSNFLPKYCLALSSGTVGEDGCGASLARVGGRNNQMVVMVDCVTPSRGYCNGSDTWLIHDGKLQNLASKEILGTAPGPYATVDRVTCGAYSCHWAGIFLEDLYDAKDDASNGNASKRQTWSYSYKTQVLSNQVGVSSNGTCLEATKVTTYDIWGKYLSDGSFAMLFTNAGPDWLNVTCDTIKCFGPVHFKLKFPVAVRDLWKREDIGIITGEEGFEVTLAPNGGSAMFRLTEVDRALKGGGAGGEGALPAGTNEIESSADE